MFSSLTAKPNRAAWMLLAVVLALTLLIYSSIELYWHRSRMNVIIGDEPHFLLIAESRVRDRDVAILNNYDMETPISRAMGYRMGSKTPGHKYNGYSMHGIGLPVLFSIPYAIRGVVGVKLFLSLIIGIGLTCTLYWILKRLLQSPSWAGARPVRPDAGTDQGDSFVRTACSLEREGWDSAVRADGSSFDGLVRRPAPFGISDAVSRSRRAAP